MLTNSYRSFQNSCVNKTELLEDALPKKHFQKPKSQIIALCDYKSFSDKEYRQTVSLIGNSTGEISFESSLDTCKSTLDKGVPIKWKHINLYLRVHQSQLLKKKP